MGSEEKKVLEKRAMLLGEMRVLLFVALFLALGMLIRFVEFVYAGVWPSYEQISYESDNVTIVVVCFFFVLVWYIRRKRIK